MFHSTSSTHTIPPTPIADPVLMRRAAITDAARIRELARLEDRRQPEGPFLVAEVAGEVVAALSLSSGVVVADPFRLTADVVAMLQLRGTQVSVADSDSPRRLRPRAERPVLAAQAA
jgi:hypothetical protein